jgi:diguanylate cyclase
MTPSLRRLTQWNLLFCTIPPLGLGLWLLWKPGPPFWITTVVDLLTCGVVLGSVIFNGLAMRRSGTDFHHWSTWLLLGMPLGYGLGEVMWSLYEVVWQVPTPFPSLADIPYIAAYPCALLSIFFLPFRARTHLSRLRILLDWCIFLLMILTLSWYTILGPIFLGASDSWLARIIGAAYPAADWLILGSLGYLLVRSEINRFPKGTALLIGGLLLIVASDTAFSWLTLQNQYQTGSLVDIGWLLGYSLISWAAFQLSHDLRQPRTLPAETLPYGRRTTDAFYVWQAFLPYLFIPLVMGLLSLAFSRGDEIPETPLTYVGCTGVIGLITLRLFLATRESVGYARQVHRLNQELDESNRRLSDMAYTDPLTGVANHRALELQTRQFLQAAQEEQRAFSVIMLDIDHFRQFNERYGHDGGDLALQAVAQTMRQTSRGDNVVARYGGEEFTILLPNTTRSEAKEAAERIRQAIAATALVFVGQDTPVQVTASLGCAAFPEDGASPQSLLKAADLALYAAKEAGRNCVRGRDEVVAVMAAAVA